MEYPEIFTKAITEWYVENIKSGTPDECTEFLKWNEAKVRYYVEWGNTYDGSNGKTDMEDEANHYERASIARRFELFIADKTNKK